MTSFVETFEAPHLGMDTESAPHRLAKGYCQVASNVLTGKPGRLPIRGGIGRVSGPAYTPATPAAIWVSGNLGNVLLSRPGNTLLTRMQGSTFTTLTGSAASIPAGRNVQVGLSSYGFSTTGALLAWDGLASPTPNYNNGPSLNKDLTYWNTRLWVLAGVGAGTSANYLDRVYWSDLVDDSALLPNTQAAWQDDVSGLTNQLVLATVGAGVNRPVGFGRLPNALIVFGTVRGDLLVGSSPTNISVRGGLVTHGCVDKRSIVELSSSVVWLAPEGVFAFDGVQEVELSTSIRTEMQPRLRSATGGAIVRLANDYLLVTIYQSGGVQTNYLLHLPTRSWSFVDLPAGVTQLVPYSANFDDGVHGAQFTNALGFDNQRLYALDGLTQNELIAPYGCDFNPAGGWTPFTASVSSRYAMLGTPMQDAKLTRLMTQTRCHVNTAATPSDATALWRARLMSYQSAVVYDWQNLTRVNDAGASVDSYRDIFEPNAEAAETYLVANFKGEADMLVQSLPELQDCYLEYDTAQKPGSF